MCVKGKPGPSPLCVTASLLTALLLTPHSVREREELLPAHFTPWAMRPHMKLAQYSHQCGPLNVWTWKRTATKWPEGNASEEALPAKSWCTHESRLVLKGHDMVTSRKALDESNWQEDKISFLLVLYVVANHTNILQFTFESNFCIGVFQLFPSQWAARFTCYAGILWALWHAAGGGGAMNSTSESWGGFWRVIHLLSPMPTVRATDAEGDT